MKNVLFVSYFFPPLGGPGVQRSVKFCKYLPKYGWNPIILTVKNVSYIAYDESLLEEVPHCVIYRTGSCDIMRLLYLYEKLLKRDPTQSIYTHASSKKKQFLRDIFPIDSKIGWISFAVRTGNKIIKKNKIDQIFSSVGPYSDAIIGYILSKKWNIPLIVDYRDLFVGSPDQSYFSQWHRRFAEKWENKVLDRAEKVIINTYRAKQRIQKLYPMINQEKFTVIYNGYDREDFLVHAARKETAEVSFTYTGGFYGERTPEFLIQAIIELNNAHALPQNVRFNFIGNYSKEILLILQKKQLNNLIRVKPQISHADAIKEMLKSDALMLFISHKDSEIVIPAKLFEYLAAKRPILAMCPLDGEAASLILHYRAGIVCETRDVKAIKDAIQFIINHKLQGNLDTLISSKNNDYSHFERSSQAKELANILDF